MLSEPRLEQRKEQHYAAIRFQVAIPFGKIVVPAWDEVHTWLAKKGMEREGVPIIRYLTTDMSKELDLEVGWTTAKAVSGEGHILGGVIPAGRYVVMVYTGSPRGKGLYKATGALLDWAQKNNISWQKKLVQGVEWWEGRYEAYITDPALQPGPQKWQTELRFLTR